MTSVLDSIPLVLVLALGPDKTPAPEDVKAGWIAMLVFVLLIAAVVFLSFSMFKRLRNADRAAAEGRYDASDRSRRSDSPASDGPPANS